MCSLIWTPTACTISYQAGGVCGPKMYLDRGLLVLCICVLCGVVRNVCPPPMKVIVMSCG